MLRYGAFEPVALEIPVDWAMNPFSSLNWRHHLLSLRWMHELPLAEQANLLQNFYTFHFILNQSNNMVNTRLGDHTTALRLEHVCKLRRDFIANNEQHMATLCERLMHEDITALLSAKVYHAGHNHGVMADTAILEALKQFPPSDPTIRESVIQRGLASQAQLYTDEGITREHSISYQEYNYPIVARFLQAIEGDITDKHQTSNIKHPDKLQKLAQGCRKVLKHFTRSNGQFFPLGDSFRLPNANIRQQYPEIILDTSEQSGEQMFCKGGFFSYSRGTAVQRLHFVATACWYSGNHKQDDDLSFCLELNGAMVFDDPGYTDFATPEVTQSLRIADVHSSVTVQENPFGSRQDTPVGTAFTDWSQHARGFMLHGRHARIPGMIVNRSWYLSDNRLTIIDSIEGEITDTLMGQHAFVLGPDLKFVIIDKRIHLLRDDHLVGVLAAGDDSGSWSAITVPYVDENRANVGQTIRLIYTAPAHIGHSFDFSFGNVT